MNPFAIPNDLRREVEQTGYLHRPLPLHPEKALETLGLKKKVLEQRVLCDMQCAAGWRAEGTGTLRHNGRKTPGGATALRMECPVGGSAWPAEFPDGDYVPFSRMFALYDLPGEDWRGYNRIHFWVYPDCEGAHALNLDLVYRNEGEEPVPDQFGREGRHEVNLVNRQWNECFLEIPALPRDKITQFGFERAAFGSDGAQGDTWVFDLGEITLQRVESPEVAEGWLPSEGKIAYSMSGYTPTGPKTALLRAGGGAPCPFRLENAAGQTVLEGTATRRDTRLGSFDVVDLSAVTTEGTYTLHAGALCTPPFPIAANVFAPSVWKVLNFVFCERCGTPVAGMHCGCHGDIVAEHNGKRLVYSGGWHDAGDLSQQTLQTGDVAFTLLEMAASAKAYDEQLYLRLLEEAEWGLDFLLKCRFGDGYYASSTGLVHWSDGLIGTFDDRPARAHCNSFDSLLYAGYYATAAGMLPDGALCERLAAFAREDFAFALRVYAEKGFDEKPSHFEHSFNTSPAQYMATQSWAASCLYRLTGEQVYAGTAAEAAEYFLRCQRTQPLGDTGLSGFFYRDDGKTVIQHYNHQSRDAVFMQALDLLLTIQPHHPDAAKWQAAVSLYAGYLKQAMAYAAPWGMLPSGVYHIAEAQDTESRERQHLYPPAEILQAYERQCHAGVQLDEEHFLRLFPVWFSFRGNAAVQLATGKAAAICARLLQDEALRGIAEEQLYWLVGKNPFCQSLLYGEGHNYPQQAVFLPGTMTGQLPVGIQTKGDSDEPYWPQANNATYKEAWLTVAGKWLSLVAELTRGEEAAC